MMQIMLLAHELLQLQGLRVRTRGPAHRAIRVLARTGALSREHLSRSTSCSSVFFHHDDVKVGP